MYSLDDDARIPQQKSRDFHADVFFLSGPDNINLLTRFWKETVQPGWTVPLKSREPHQARHMKDLALRHPLHPQISECICCWLDHWRDLDRMFQTRAADS